MGSQKAPAAPKSPVGTQDLQQAWGSANQYAAEGAGNELPRQAYDFYAPQLMSATPYGYDPAQGAQFANQWAQQGPQMFNYANQVMNTGFDPQNALYDRTQQRLQNQMRSSQGARGIQMSPHGAGLENQGMSDFNIDWENQQLQRQALASQAASQLWGQGGEAIQGGVQLGQQVPRDIATYAGMLQQLGMGAYAPEMWGAQQYGNLFSAGAGAQNENYKGALKAHEINENANSSMWGGIGKLTGQLGSAAIMASDRKVKKDIQKIGEDPRGWNIYKFKYALKSLGDEEELIGFMADEVESIMPDVVLTDPVTGMKFIDYATLI